MNQESPGWGPQEDECVRQLAALALEEDLNGPGDITSDRLIPLSQTGSADLIIRSQGVLAGLPAARRVFQMVDPALNFTERAADGDRLAAGTLAATVSGSMRAILTAERTALNFLQRLSGVATLTRRYVDAVADLPCQVLDTRKTIPGWRRLEKYAVRRGGGRNHRFGLFDMVLIKDNHLAALETAGMDPIATALNRARAALPPGVRVEVEVSTLEQLESALGKSPDVVLLDNMSLETMREAVARRRRLAPHVLLEASGGVNLDTIRAIAETGVDFISVGALTHSAPALDIALDYHGSDRS